MTYMPVSLSIHNNRLNFILLHNSGNASLNAVSKTAYLPSADAKTKLNKTFVCAQLLGEILFEFHISKISLKL